MSNQDGNSIFDELDSRLDDFFAEDDEIFDEEPMDFSEDELDGASEAPAEQPAQIPESEPVVIQKPEKNTNGPLDSLKAVVLEMDWEINDENLNNYLDEIEKLKSDYKQDRALYLFFKLHNSIGKYMLHRKAGAHPEALKFLYQVFNSLEKVFTKQLSDFDKNKLALNEINNFKNLKAKMFPDKYSHVEESALSEQHDDVNKPDFSNLPEDIQKEINEYIEREISMKIEALKKEFNK